VYPVAESHVNNEIKEFLDHFSTSRMINLTPKATARKREDEEKGQIQDEFSSAMTAESEKFA